MIEQGNILLELNAFLFSQLVASSHPLDNLLIHAISIAVFLRLQYHLTLSHQKLDLRLVLLGFDKKYVDLCLKLGAS